MSINITTKNSHNIDLSNQTIVDFDFTEYKLLRFANFSNSIIENCNLTDCVCSFSNFTDTTLRNTDITGIIIPYATLEKLKIENCLFEGDIINKLPSVVTEYRYDIVISDNNLRIGWISKPFTEWETMDKNSDMDDEVLKIWVNHKQDIQEMVKCHKNNISLDKIIGKVIVKKRKSKI